MSFSTLSSSLRGTRASRPLAHAHHWPDCPNETVRVAKDRRRLTSCRSIVLRVHPVRATASPAPLPSQRGRGSYSRPPITPRRMERICVYADDEGAGSLSDARADLPRDGLLGLSAERSRRTAQAEPRANIVTTRFRTGPAKPCPTVHDASDYASPPTANGVPVSPSYAGVAVAVGVAVTVRVGDGVIGHHRRRRRRSRSHRCPDERRRRDRRRPRS